MFLSFFFCLLFGTFIQGKTESTTIFKVITVASHSTEQIPLSNLLLFQDKNSLKDGFFLVSTHSHIKSIILSYERNGRFSAQESITGSNIGLVLLLDGHKENNLSVWVSNRNREDIDVLVSVSQFSGEEPIPGGCNLEFPVEISPFLKITTDSIRDRIEYQHASLSERYQRDCIQAQLMINYDLYIYYLKENDYSEEEYFRAIKIMSEVNSIKQNAIKVMNTPSSPTTRSFVMAYSGRGVVYNLVASADNYSVPYVPIVSYNCDTELPFTTCGNEASFLTNAFLISLGVFGLLICLRGHHYFTLQMLFFGFIAAATPTFIIMSKFGYFTVTEKHVCMLLAGIVGGAIWTAFWKFFKQPFISVLLSGIVLGFLLVSCVLFSPLGNNIIFKNDLNYWLVISCGSLMVPVVLLPFGIVLSIVSSGIVGAYCAMVTVDRYIGGSLSYIAFNILRRAIFEESKKAANLAPIQNKDIALFVGWALLSLFGIALQFYCHFRSRNSTESILPCTCTCNNRGSQRSRNGHRNSRPKRRRKSRMCEDCYHHYTFRTSTPRFEHLPPLTVAAAAPPVPPTVSGTGYVRSVPSGSRSDPMDYIEEERQPLLYNARQTTQIIHSSQYVRTVLNDNDNCDYHGSHRMNYNSIS